MYCHSIELVLKAFLLVKGVSKQELKENPLGHNLETLLQRAEKQGLGSLVHISPGQQSELVRANNYYKSKQFEYFDLPMIMEATTGYKKLPDLTLLDQLADTLITGLRSYCLTA